MSEAVLRAIREQLDQLPAGVAALTMHRDGPTPDVLWEVEVVPAVDGASRLTVVGADDNDEVTVSFGETHIYLWGTPADVAGTITDFADAIFNGRIEEVGPRGNSRARLRRSTGEVVSVGSIGWPERWSRRRRRYQSYVPNS